RHHTPVAALRKRLLRPVGAPRPCRPRSDHRRRARGRRAPRPLLRKNRRVAGHGTKPSVPASRHDRNGAADLIRRRCRARQEDGAVPGDPSHFPGRRRARQYSAGVVLDKKVRDYRHEPDVAPDSSTETYVALKLGIDNRRWAGVPFYLRTGKSLCARNTEIAVQFRQAPYALFRDTPVERLPANILTLRIQPDEGLSLSFSAKRPGAEIEIDG